jgi:hypothetical protein
VFGFVADAPLIPSTRQKSQVINVLTGTIKVAGRAEAKQSLAAG